MIKVRLNAIFCVIFSSNVKKSVNFLRMSKKISTFAAAKWFYNVGDTFRRILRMTEIGCKGTKKKWKIQIKQ